MRALVTNDDGIGSRGLSVLAQVGLDAGYEVLVVAPTTEYSGASASLFGATEDGRLATERLAPPDLPDGVESLAVGAAPGLIAFLAAHEAFGPRPDVVLSGVNRGPNTGHAVIHSGTVGAAMSSVTHGIHGMAVSLDASDPRHWDTAGLVAAHGLRWLVTRPAEDGVLNLNVPDLPAAEVRGLRKAPLARFGAVEARVDALDEPGALQVSYAEIDRSRDAASDAGLLAAGWATMSLLRAPCFEPEAELPELDRL
ncbi:5'/3'-nucleotidase SurE [Actinotalea sp. AC32]|nr:5'/3'-nucleotidase SurE [Actinotalea sp. AC32]